MTERSWVQTHTMETIFQAPFIWIKAWNKKLWKTLTRHCCMCCNPANGRVDFEDWSAYKIQLHGSEWIVSLSADWDQKVKKKNLLSLKDSTIITGYWLLLLLCQISQESLETYKMSLSRSRIKFKTVVPPCLVKTIAKLFLLLWSCITQIFSWNAFLFVVYSILLSEEQFFASHCWRSLHEILDNS
jgi:hypothetical protein